ADVLVKVDKKRADGKVIGMTATDVTIEQSAMSDKIPVNEILYIKFDDEPKNLEYARTAFLEEQYERALNYLQKIKPADLDRSEVKQDFDFLNAATAARVALRGNGAIGDAGKQVLRFIAAYPNNYHHLEALEMVGDLLGAVRQYPKAREYYEKLAKEAPWPDYQLRAAVAIGRMYAEDNKPAEAIKYFDKVLAAKAEDDLTVSQQLFATLGKARCLSETNQHDPAIKLVQGLIEKTPADESDLLAQAFNTLGNSLHKAGRTQEALYAFLRVDTLYSGNPESHAEALANLHQLWKELRRPDRAAEAKQALESQYPESRWAKGLEK
ncbi:MAG: tetratricopeptide repeat protein, partial [Candidatus Aminicenantales bacterium]